MSHIDLQHPVLPSKKPLVPAATTLEGGGRFMNRRTLYTRTAPVKKGARDSMGHLRGCTLAGLMMSHA